MIRVQWGMRIQSAYGVSWCTRNENSSTLREEGGGGLEFGTMEWFYMVYDRMMDWCCTKD